MSQCLSSSERIQNNNIYFVSERMPNKYHICYNKNTNDLLKCKQCKNNVCDVCFANIIFNNEKFNNDYIDNKTKFTCPYCKYHNVFNTKINNYNTNDKIIKLLINKRMIKLIYLIMI